MRFSPRWSVGTSHVDLKTQTEAVIVHVLSVKRALVTLREGVASVAADGTVLPPFISPRQAKSQKTQCEDAALRGKKRKREIYIFFLIEQCDGCTLDDPARLRSYSLFTAPLSGKASSEEAAGECKDTFPVNLAAFGSFCHLEE